MPLWNVLEIMQNQLIFIQIYKIWYETCLSCDIRLCMNILYDRFHIKRPEI